MAELEPHASPPGGDDPISHLHKMSTTAGVGSQEYVAINGSAIVAALLGVLSLLVLLRFTLLFLGVPLVGIVVGLAALRQIRDSNGTQSGRKLAWLGIAACALLLGGRVAWDVGKSAAQRPDQAQINHLIEQLADDVRQHRWPAAYGHFDSSFQMRVDSEMFRRRWEAFEKQFGPIVQFKPNRQYEFIESGAGRSAYTMAIIQWQRSDADRHTLLVQRGSEGQWRIRESGFFPPPERERGGMGP